MLNKGESITLRNKAKQHLRANLFPSPNNLLNNKVVPHLWYDLLSNKQKRHIRWQYYTCAICSRPMKPSEKDVDHCHLCGRVRGTICMYCNLLKPTIILIPSIAGDRDTLVKIWDSPLFKAVYNGNIERFGKVITGKDLPSSYSMDVKAIKRWNELCRCPYFVEVMHRRKDIYYRYAYSASLLTRIGYRFACERTTVIIAGKADTKEVPYYPFTIVDSRTGEVAIRSENIITIELMVADLLKKYDTKSVTSYLNHIKKGNYYYKEQPKNEISSSANTEIESVNTLDNLIPAIIPRGYPQLRLDYLFVPKGPIIKASKDFKEKLESGYWLPYKDFEIMAYL